MYRMLKKHEIILEDVLKRLVKIIIRLGQVTGESLNPETKITIDFDDSIIEDKETERQQDRTGCQYGSYASGRIPGKMVRRDRRGGKD